VRHNQDALLQLTSVIRAVPVLAGLISSSHSDATVRLKAIQLLADIASTQPDGRKQVRKLDSGLESAGRLYEQLAQLACCK
jgi:hypothetical protein